MQAKLILALVILSLIGLAAWYYKWSQAEITVLRGNVITLQQAKKLQDDTIKSMEADAESVGKTLIVANAEFDKARTENIALRRKLAKHDISYLAYKKPKLVQKILTNATKNAERCFAILSGAPLTEKEKSATKKSEANGECPHLANPNYKARK